MPFDGLRHDHEWSRKGSGVQDAAQRRLVMSVDFECRQSKCPKLICQRRQIGNFRGRAKSLQSVLIHDHDQIRKLLMFLENQ